MRPGGSRSFSQYTPPGIDSPRARANAILFLTQCVKLDHLTVEFLSRQYRLKPPTAQALLLAETKRREAWDA